jgi:hypothetical protein
MKPNNGLLHGIAKQWTITHSSKEWTIDTTGLKGIMLNEKKKPISIDYCRFLLYYTLEIV